jgi:carbon-nitrogen hydrolase
MALSGGQAAQVFLALGDKDALAHGARFENSARVGSSIRKVDPLPKVDSTQMRPPCISMICSPVRATQLPAVAFDPSRTTEKLGESVPKAASLGAKFIVFPEAFVGGYPKGLDFGTAACLPGATTAPLEHRPTVRQVPMTAKGWVDLGSS